MRIKIRWLAICVTKKLKTLFNHILLLTSLGVVLDPGFDRNVSYYCHVWLVHRFEFFQVTEDNYADIAAEISSFSTDSLDNATLQTTELLKNISKVFNDIAELVKLLPSSSDIHPLVRQISAH